MELLDLGEVIKIYQTQVGLVEKIWSYFYAVSIAVLSFPVLSKEKIRKPGEVAVAITGYVIFTIGSASSLWRGQTELYFFFEKVQQLDPDTRIEAFKPCEVAIFQAVIAVIVVLAIFSMYVHRKKEKSDGESKDTAKNGESDLTSSSGEVET